MKTLQEDAEKFAAFILENYPDAQSWKNPVAYCTWYISHFFIAAVCGDDGEIVAVGAARPVERAGMGVIPCYFNEKGRCLHIDLLIDVSKDERAIIALGNLCKARFPLCKTVAMFRHFEEQLHVYSIGKFWKSMNRFRKKKKQYEHAEEKRTVSP